MERAFKISDTSKYAVDLDKYIERANYTNSKIKELTKKLGIEANMYFLYGNGMCNVPFNEFGKKDIRFAILPTDNDLKKFSKELCKADNEGYRSFRVNSKTMKEIQDFCIEEKIIINLLPLDERDYFQSLRWRGYSRQRFKLDGILYMKISSEALTEDDIPEGFEIIKLSEFYSKLEKYKEDNKDE